MFQFRACAILAGLCLWSLAAAGGDGDNKKVLITMKWKGSVEDRELRKDAPECITSYKGLDKVWKAWKIKGQAPKLDFSEIMVIAVYSSGSQLSFIDPTLDEKGNLQVAGFGTRDLRPGFRFVLGVVSKAGVATVNGKKLPKE